MGEVEDALAALASGDLVVVPTETVYGLAAPLHPEALDGVFRLKGRPRDKPLPVLGASLEQLRDVAAFDAQAEALARRFWPGPLTLVAPRAPSFRLDLGGRDDSTVGVRVPACDTTLALLRAWGPLAVTSANRSGDEPARTVEEARAVFGGSVSVYVDGGRLSGVPSTVVSIVEGLEVLRPGEISPDDIAQAGSP